MQLKFKKLSEKAVMPVIKNPGDAGMDLTCTSISTMVNECGQLMLVYHTDLAVEIPEGYVGLLVSRSSIFKKSLILTDCVGIIDSGYRGEIMGTFKTTTDVIPAVYKEGERFAQLVIVPCPTIEIVEAEELSETERGENGYGSTGNTNEETAEQSNDETNE